MPDILAGALVRSGDRPAAAWAVSTSEILNVTSTSYIATPGSLVQLTFTAPTTGRVWLICGGQTRDDGIANRKVEMAPEVRLGTDATGVLFLAADWETRGISGIVNTPQWHGYGRMTLLTGLTPGATYFARHMYRVNAASSTCDIRYRSLGVIPA